MKSPRTLVVLLAALLMTTTPSRSDEKVVRQQIEAEYLRADEATRARDLDRLMKHYTSDFTLKDGAKKYDRKEVGTMMHWQIVGTKEIKSLAFKIQALSVKGDTAVATVKQSETMIVYKNQTPYLLESEQVSDDTWISTANGWRLKHQEVKQKKTTVDGKPIK